MKESPVNALAAGMAEAATAQEEATQSQEEQIEHKKYVGRRNEMQTVLNQQAEKIANDSTTDAGYRSRALATLWTRAGEASAALETEYTQILEEWVNEAEKEVFSVPAPDRDSTRQAYNDVRTRLEYTSEFGDGPQAAREELNEIMERALRTGDKPLARAAFHRAAELGYADIRDRYLSTSQEKSNQWADYVYRRKKLADWTDPQSRVFQTLEGRRGLVKPKEMRR